MEQSNLGLLENWRISLRLYASRAEDIRDCKLVSSRDNLED